MSIRPAEDLKVRDVMMPPEQFPVIRQRTLFKEALEEMGRFRIGLACIVGEDLSLKGIITDGDVRRMLLTVQKPVASLFVDDALDHAMLTPTTASPDDSLSDAVCAMEGRGVWDLPVTDEGGRLLGLLHLHPAVKRLLTLAENASNG